MAAPIFENRFHAGRGQEIEADIRSHIKTIRRTRVLLCEKVGRPSSVTSTLA